MTNINLCRAGRKEKMIQKMKKKINQEINQKINQKTEPEIVQKKRANNIVSLISRASAVILCFALISSCFSGLSLKGSAKTKVFNSSYNTHSGTMAGGPGLFRKSDGYERVELNKGKGLVVEDYDNDFNIISSKTVDEKYILPTGCRNNDLKYGNTYEGKDYNFVCTGRNNQTQSTSLVTLMVAKFDKNWNYMGKCEMNDECGVEIYNCFDWGSCAMLELNGMLYLSTGREGFGDIHHQGKVNVLINISDMKYLGSASDFWHSFSQYLTICNNKMYQMELSEGSRRIYVEELDPAEYKGIDSKSAWTDNLAAGAKQNKTAAVFNFWEKKNRSMWSYALGGEAGGFTSSDSKGRLLCAGVARDQKKFDEQNGGSGLAYNVWVRSLSSDVTTLAAVSGEDSTGSVTSESSETSGKSETSETSEGKYGTSTRSSIIRNNTGNNQKKEYKAADLKEIQLTDYKDGGNEDAGTPHIAKVNDNKFLVIWPYSTGDSDEYYTEDGYSEGNLKYVFIDAFGNKISDVYSMKGNLSDVVPVNDGNGNLVWYSSSDGSVTFYKISPDGQHYSKSLESEKKKSKKKKNKVTSVSAGSFKRGKLYYKIINDGSGKKKAKVTGATGKYFNISVPAKIEYDGNYYKVTEIVRIKSSLLKKLTIGKNVKIIDKKAFSGNRKLKKVIIKSKKITKIGKNSFGTGSRMSVKVPSSKKKKYSKMLKKSGFKGKIMKA